jgi:HNH endonuclease
MPNKHPIKSLPSAAFLRECFTYNSVTGDLRWRIRSRKHFTTNLGWSSWNAKYAGTKAGYVDKKHRYRVIDINRRHCLAHRVIWKWVTGKDPTEEIDHIDMDRDNNRWKNLREATVTQQQYNKRRRKHGAKQTKNGKWMARITMDGKRQYLGLFTTLGEASAAYEAAARQIHGEFYRSPNRMER